MAQITWRDVAAPDFSSAANGFAQFSKILGDSLTGLRSSVGAFDKAQSDRVNNQLALELAKIPDAAKAQEAIQNGRVGSLDLSAVADRLSPEALKMISPEALTRLGADQAALATTRRDMAQQAVRDSQAPLFAKINEALRSGNTDLAKEYLGRADFNGFGYNAVQKLNAETQDTEQNALGLIKDRWSFSNSKDDRADDTAAQAAFQSIRAAALNAEDARLHLYDEKGPAAGLSTRARARLENMLSEQYQGLFGASDGGAAPVAGGVGGGVLAPEGGPVSTGSPWSTVFGNGKFGSADVANMNMGDVVKFGEEVLIPRTKAAGYGKNAKGEVLGTSASGAFQITQSTLKEYAPRLFGANWRNMQFSPAAQEAIAKQIFEDSKGGNLKARWEGLPDSRPGAYKNMTWEQVKPLILRHELGQNAADLLLNNRGAQVQLATRSMEDSRHGLDIDFEKTLVDTRTPGQLAAQLTEGTFKGTSRGFLVDQINRIMREGKVNAATAAAVLERNVSGSKNAPWWDLAKNLENTQNRLRGGTPALGGGISLNDEGLKADIALLAQMGKTGIQSQIAARAARTVDMSQLASAQANLAAAQAEYSQALQRLPTQPGLKATMPLKLAKLEAAKQQVIMLQQLADKPSNQPN